MTHTHTMNIKRTFLLLFLLPFVVTTSLNTVRAEDSNSTSSDSPQIVTIDVGDRDLDKQVTLHSGQELIINITPHRSGKWWAWSNFSNDPHDYWDKNRTMDMNYDLDNPSYSYYEISYRLTEKIGEKYRNVWPGHCNLEEERELNTDSPLMSYHFKARESVCINEELPKTFLIELFSFCSARYGSFRKIFVNVHVTIQP